MPQDPTLAPPSDKSTLPRWHLADLYAGPTAPELDADLLWAQTAAQAFAERHQGHLAEESAAQIGQAIADYEKIQERLARIGSYIALLYNGDMSDPAIVGAYQTIMERINDIGTFLLFFTLELNRIDDALIAGWLTDESVARYRAWLRDVRAFRPYQLGDDVEKLLHEKFVTGRAAWCRLFDETMASLRFPLDGKDHTSAEIFDYFSSPDRDKRAAAAKTIATTLRRHDGQFALITNTLAKDKEIEDRWRGFARPISARNLSNLVEDSVVDALIAAVKAAYPRLSHRYYRLKARWLGLAPMQYWDRNAPLPGDDGRRIDWNGAREIVLDAYRRFSPDMAAVGARFFEEGWIDAAVRPGKSPGAFAHPVVPSAHPYILLNYQGRLDDVMTLAHELGHGVHQVLAGAQGYLQADTPLTLAETASVFGEMLTFRSLLDQETDPVRKRVMLADKVESMLNTVIRQIAFVDFERMVHEERRKGDISVARLNEIWLLVQRESLGDGFELPEEYGIYWSYIPHFIHSPFYVYAYAFGDCLVNSLYAAYEAAPDGFAERYLTLLRAGGTLRHDALLAPFGLDARDPGFWAQGLGMIERFIDTLETETMTGVS